MKDNIAKIMLFLLAIVGLSLLIVECVPSNTDSNLYDVTCEVTIINPILQDTQFKNWFLEPVKCTSKKSSLFSITDWISDSGNLKMEAQGKYTTKNYIIREELPTVYPLPRVIPEQKHELRINDLKSGDTVINFYLYDEDEHIIDFISINYIVGDV